MKNLCLLILSLFLFNASYAGDGVEIGDVAPQFNLKSTDGKMISLENIDDAKGHIVIFSCNTCPYVVMYEERMIELHNNFASKGYPVLAINSNDVIRKPGDSFDEMVKRAKDLEFPFTYVYDETQEVAAAFGATRTPQVYLLKKNSAGELIVSYIGSIDDSARDAEDVEEKYLENAIASLEKGQSPEKTVTKAIGCTIKWAEK